jgi:hypothetical protein
LVSVRAGAAGEALERSRRVRLAAERLVARLGEEPL